MFLAPFLRRVLTCLLAVGAAAAQAQVPAPLPTPNLPLTLAGDISSIAYQPDGALLLVGTFTSVNGVPRNGVARLLPDGSLDPHWNPPVRWGTQEIPRRIYSLPDGGVLVQGNISHYDGQWQLGCGVKLTAGPNPAAVPSWYTNAGGCVPSDITFDDAGWAYFVSPAGLRRVRADTGMDDANWAGQSYSYGIRVYDGNGGLIQVTDSALTRVLIATGALDANWQALGNVGSGLIGGAVEPSSGFVFLAYADGRVDKRSTATGQSASGWPQFAPCTRSETFARASNGDLYLGGYEAVCRISGSTGQVLASWPIEGERKSLHSLAARADGSVAAAGNFGRLGTTPMMGLALLGAAAAEPAALALTESSGGATRLARQPDGALIVAGNFDRAGGVDRRNLLRLQPNGALDLAWAPRVDGWTYALAVGPDGGIYVGGYLESVNGVAVSNGLRKLDGSTGAILTDYVADTGTDTVSGLYVDSSSRVHLTGYRAERPVRRLLPDGAMDWSWGTSLSLTTSDGLQRIGNDLYVSIRSGGDFSPRRLSLLTGAIDADWNVAMQSFPALSIAQAADGDLFIGGFFDNVNGVPRRHLARVSSTTPVQVRDWNPSPDLGVYGLGTTPSGRLFVSGYFTQIGGKPRNGNAELAPSDGTALDSWIAPVGSMQQLLTDDRIYFSTSPRGVIAYPLAVGDTIFATPFE